MPRLNRSITRACRGAPGCMGIATMGVAASINAMASQLSTQETSVQDTQTEKEKVLPDNSKKNMRDRNDQNPTPMDQGGSAQDTKITRDIRKEISHKKEVSTNGKNVKIITVNGVVTLRGPVASSQEKHLINDIACKIAGPTKVKNEMEV